MTRPFLANTIVLSFLLLILMQPLPVLSQTLSNLGIFDATADWGLEPEFPPKQGYHKVPGRVDISGEGDSLVFDLYGNGDKIWDLSDEGFFVYTERSGSWRIGGFFDWISRGGSLTGSEKTGLMVREKGNQTESKNMLLFSRCGLTRPYGDQVEVQWRSQIRDLSDNVGTLGGANGYPIAQPGQGVYLRVTYIAPKNLLIAESSEDGILWHVIHNFRMIMGENPAYGIAISNETDNDQLAHARISQLSVQPAPPIATRTIKPDYFKIGDTITVELEIFNPLANESDRLEKQTTSGLPHLLEY